jgi:predicted dehydrogenase
VEDTAKITLFMRNGSFGTIDLSWNTPAPSKTYLEIYGEEGTILLDPEGVTYQLKTWSDWKRKPNRIRMDEAFPRQTSHFVDSIASKKPTVLSNEDGLMAQIIIDATYESAKRRTNIPVELPLAK